MSDEALPEKCPECGSRGIEFSGRGLETQYKICSRYKDDGHARWSPDARRGEADIPSECRPLAPVREVRMSFRGVMAGSLRAAQFQAAMQKIGELTVENARLREELAHSREAERERCAKVVGQFVADLGHAADRQEIECRVRDGAPHD